MDQPNGNGKIKQEHRFTKLEGQMENVLTNHLPHLQDALDELSKKVSGLSNKAWAILVGILMILVSVYFK